MAGTYSGTYRPKNVTKYSGDHTNVVYRSLWEKYCFKWCDMNSDIESWSSEEVVVPYRFMIDKRVHRYFIDLKIKFKDGRTILVEIKPHSQTLPPKQPQRKTKRYLEESLTYVKNQNKWDAAEKYAKERGWEFQIWTERELEKMGIMPKSRKGLKKLPAFPNKKKK